MILTVNQLERAAPYLDFRRIELIVPNFNNTCKKYNINNPYRVAHFLTQVLIESNYFRNIQEPGQGVEYEGKEEIGNIERGDGRRFIGRGYIKLLGRKMYQEYKDFSKVDVIAYPHCVTTPRVAMDIAGWIWNKKNLNLAADLDRLWEITKVLTGLNLFMRQREDLLERVKKSMNIEC